MLFASFTNPRVLYSKPKLILNVVCNVKSLSSVFFGDEKRRKIFGCFSGNWLSNLQTLERGRCFGRSFREQAIRYARRIVTCRHCETMSRNFIRFIANCSDKSSLTAILEVHQAASLFEQVFVAVTMFSVYCTSAFCRRFA